jgi:DUF4097 and DUF4098 domain-containing protein YvlB
VTSQFTNLIRVRTLVAGPLAPATLLALLAAGGALGATSVDETLEVAPDGTVEVVNVAGDIVVEGWPESVVHVTGELGKSVERLEFETTGDRTVVEVIYRSGSRGSSDLEVRIPEASRLEVRAVSAPISVSGVRGRQRLETVSGDITTEVFGDDLEAETVSGDLEVEGRDNLTHTTLRTVSGDIDTEAVSGDLEASTVSGSIETEANSFTRVRLNTTNGRITVDAGLEPDGRADLSTTNGRVELTLDHDRDLDVDAQTFTGSIDNCFGEAVEKSRYSPERTLRFQRGDANRTIRIRSMVGKIEICADEHR